MERIIKSFKHKTLNNLTWEKGEAFAIEGSDQEYYQPFILGKIKSLYPRDSKGGYHLVFNTVHGNNEEWTLYTYGKLIEIKHSIPLFKKDNISFFSRGYRRRNIFIENAYSGIEVIKYMNSNPQLKPYVDWALNFNLFSFIEKKLPTKRRKLSKILGCF